MNYGLSYRAAWTLVENLLKPDIAANMIFDNTNIGKKIYITIAKFVTTLQIWKLETRPPGMNSSNKNMTLLDNLPTFCGGCLHS